MKHVHDGEANTYVTGTKQGHEDEPSEWPLRDLSVHHLSSPCIESTGVNRFTHSTGARRFGCAAQCGANSAGRSPLRIRVATSCATRSRWSARDNRRYPG